MAVVKDDIKPWMLEPATPKQLDFIYAIARVLEIPFCVNTKLEASNFITQYRDEYYIAIERRIKLDSSLKKNRVIYGCNVSPRFRDDSPRGYSTDAEIAERDYRDRIRKEVLAEQGLAIGPWGEIYCPEDE